MKNSISFFVIFGIIFFADSCSKKQNLVHNKYLQWFEKNQKELIAIKPIGNLTYSIRFLPTDYLILKELDTSFTRQKFDSLRNIKNGMQYLSLRVKTNTSNQNILAYKISSEGQYNQRLEYFSFLIKNDITLIDGNDTLRCLMSNFERYYGYAPFITFMLGFQASNNDNLSDKTLILNDVAFNNGKIILTIDKNNLKKIPNLKL